MFLFLLTKKQNCSYSVLNGIRTAEIISPKTPEKKDSISANSDGVGKVIIPYHIYIVERRYSNG